MSELPTEPYRSGEPLAERVVATTAERRGEYAHPSENHGLTAQLWGHWLSSRLRTRIDLTAEDVCMLNMLQKASRLANGTHEDSLLDVQGWIENVPMLEEDQRNSSP